MTTSAEDGPTPTTAIDLGSAQVVADPYPASAAGRINVFGNGLMAMLDSGARPGRDGLGACVEEMLRRMPRLEQAGEPVPRGTFGLRGYRRVPVGCGQYGARPRPGRDRS